MSVDSAREKSLSDYRKKLMEHKEVEAKLKDLRLVKFSLLSSLNVSCQASAERLEQSVREV